MDSSPNQNTNVQNLEDSLYQGFLNVIARKNAAQRMMNFGTSTKDKRKQAIANAVNKLQANLENFQGGLENYSATQAFTDAANTNKKHRLTYRPHGIGENATRLIRLQPDLKT